MSALSRDNIVCLSGGVGGARFLHGLVSAAGSANVTAVVNTGDDFVHWGLEICPDLDTVMYHLANLADEQRGWGLAGETFAAKDMVQRYGGETWFALGDADLATHLMRSERLRSGKRLTEVTAELCGALGVEARVLPMSDQPRATMIDTAEHGALIFQHWFVRERTEPAVQRVWFDGAKEPTPEVLHAIESASVVLIGPSNPYVSIDPILTLRGVRELLEQKPVISVSPIVGGRAVKGPLARMIRDLAGHAPSAGAVAAHYGGLLHGMVVEHGDAASVHARAPGCRTLETNTIMSDRAAAKRLAEQTLAFAARLAEAPRAEAEPA